MTHKAETASHKTSLSALQRHKRLDTIPELQPSYMRIRCDDTSPSRYSPISDTAISAFSGSEICALPVLFTWRKNSRKLSRHLLQMARWCDKNERPFFSLIFLSAWDNTAKEVPDGKGCLETEILSFEDGSGYFGGGYRFKSDFGVVVCNLLLSSSCRV